MAGRGAFGERVECGDGLGSDDSCCRCGWSDVDEDIGSVLAEVEFEP